MAGVLEGLTVLDLSGGVAGPMTGMLLADQGARVIKIEPPGGDPSRNLAGSRVWNRGKQSAVLDLRADPDRGVLDELLGTADVLLRTCSASTAERLGIDPPTLSARSRTLISCSITGYGDLHKHRGRPAVDALVAARTGLQWEKRGWPGGSIEHINRLEPAFPDLEIDREVMEGPPRPGPLFSAVPWPSLSACYLASVGISAALHVREITGRGQHIHTSMLQGALINGAFTWQRAELANRAGYRMWVTDPRVPHGFFRAADGQWVHNWVPHPSFVLGVSADADLTLGPNTRSARHDGSRMGMDPDELLVALETYKPMAEAFARFPAAEWERVAADAGVSVQRVRSPEEALQDPSFLADGCVAEVDDPEAGPIRHVGITYHLHARPVAVSGPAPPTGYHTALIRSEAAVAAANSEDGTQLAGSPHEPMSFDRGPLTGVTVLDLGLAVAGPFGAQMLADLGADVVKVNSPHDRVWTDYYMGMCCNRGKRSIIVNLKTAVGLEVLRSLVMRCDVVHTNMRWDAVEALGIDYESLRAINPRLIYCHTRGFENGPRSRLPGHDQSASALTGVAWEEGGLYDNGKPIWPNISLGDTGNGLLSATAVLQALYHRDRTGEGQFVDTSIVYVHLLNASSAWVTADGRANDRPHLDAMQLGLTALYRLYETRDGWLCLAAITDQHWHDLCSAVGRAELAHDGRFSDGRARWTHDKELVATLEPLFASATAAEWFRVLDDHHVPCEISSETFALDLFDDAEMIQRGLVVRHDHPLVGPLDMLGRTIDFSDTPGVIDRGPIVAGQHTREILSEIGYAEPEIADLISAGAVAESADLPPGLPQR